MLLLLLLLIMNKKEEIIDLSLKLFNEYGIDKVSTNLISRKLNISPGNLYYYFKNKEDILNEIFIKYEEDFNKKITPITQGNSNIEIYLQSYIDSIFYIQWRYRFFYLNMFSIMKSHSDIHIKCLILTKKNEIILRKIVDGLFFEKMINIQDDDIEHLCDVIKVHTTSWMSYRITVSNKNMTQSLIHKEIMNLLYILKSISTDNGNIFLSKIKRNYISKIRVM